MIRFNTTQGQLADLSMALSDRHGRCRRDGARGLPPPYPDSYSPCKMAYCRKKPCLRRPHFRHILIAGTGSRASDVVVLCILNRPEGGNAVCEATNMVSEYQNANQPVLTHQACDLPSRNIPSSITILSLLYGMACSYQGGPMPYTSSA